MGHYIRSNSICYISSKSEEKYEYEVKNMQIIIKENDNYYGSKSKTRAFLFGCSITQISGMNNTTRMRSPTTSGTIISHNLLFPLSGRKSLFSKSGICVPAHKVVHVIWSQNTVKLALYSKLRTYHACLFFSFFSHIFVLLSVPYLRPCDL